MEFLHLLEGIRTPFFNVIFQFITLFGEETLFMIFALTFFWCINKRTGYFLLYIGIAGALANALLKLLFCVPRPWILDPDFTIVESAREGASGYSFPSGHTQTATGLYLGVARSHRSKTLRILCVALIILVGFSRMYLGVHTPADVLVSLGIGILLVFGAYPLFQRAWDRDYRWFIPLIGFLLLISAGLIVVMEVLPSPAGAVETFSKACISGGYKMIGAALGYCFVLWLDTHYLHFDTKAVWWAQILKVTGGLVIIMAIRALKAPLLALTGGHDIGNALRYFLMFAVCGGLWPLSFPWFSTLGEKKPDTDQA